jgi:protein-tyrosine-phosphatase
MVLFKLVRKEEECMPMNKKFRVLVVCSVNKGRSPAFSAYLKHFVKQRGLGNIEVNSAGTNEAIIKMLRRSQQAGPSYKVKVILSREGVHEINSHKAKPITKSLVEKSNLILAVSSKNKEKILAVYPEARGKTFTIKEFVRIKGSKNIKDAHYHRKLDTTGGVMYDKTTRKGTMKAYRKMLKEIRVLAKMAAERLENK